MRNRRKDGNAEMNVIYFTLDDFDSLEHYHSINTDLLREFMKNGHRVYVVSPSERKKGFPTRVLEEKGAKILKPRIGNMQKTNIVEKGISTLTIGGTLIRAIKKHFSDVRFDLILYCTPPITFLGAVEYIKTRDQAATYLLLKDIFPQNAVDIGMMTTEGPKGFLYRHFREQEKKLYAISDRIGCMSPANVKFLLDHNPEVRERDENARRETGRGIVEVCPNAIDVTDQSVDAAGRAAIRKKYDIPPEKKVFLYGGNLGRPQGIPFVLECLKKCEALEEALFLIVGDGTEYHLLQEYVEREQPKNVRLMKRLPKEDYDTMVGACDVGLIFLDHRFTIPNFPSRILSYMQARIPVLACTDPNTDVGQVVEAGRFGWWCESDQPEKFLACVLRALEEDRERYGRNGFDYLSQHFAVSGAYETIVSRERKPAAPRGDA